MKRILILDNEFLNKCWRDVCEDWALEEQRKLKVSASALDYSNRKIPEDYDLYLIHTSHVSEKSLRELRECRPSCMIVGNGSGGTWEAGGKDFGDLFNYFYSMRGMKEENVESALEELFEK
jgi:hypothetical protein